MTPTRKQRSGRSGANLGRLAAARALIHVEQGGHADDALAEHAPERSDDRRLAWFLALGVLRRMSRVDASIQKQLSQPLHGLDAEVRASLRLGTFECLFARTKRYAAVDQAVEVVKALGAGRARGLVNAVLRRVGHAPDLSRAEFLDHPAWLVARWDDRYGPEATSTWCENNGEPPPLFVVARDSAMSLAGDLEAAGVHAVAHEIGGEVLEGVLRVSGVEGVLTELPGYDDGRWWVQDAASAYMADLVPGDSGRVLDACAAPGGKTFRLIARGFEVTATDASSPRLDLMRANLSRLQMNAPLQQHDWTTGPLDGAGEFDAVIVDAPCSGLGTVRRHPEIRWRRMPEDLVAQQPKQLSILKHAASHCRAGGVVVYVVCSPEPEEGPEVVRAFLEAHQEFQLDEERCTAPPRDQEDAFYGARLIRR